MKQDLQFQESLLKYIIQSRDSRKYIPDVDSDLFADEVYQFLFNLFKDYLKKYKYTPSEENLTQHFINKLPEINISTELEKIVYDKLKILYQPLVSDTLIYDNTIRLFVQKVKTKKVISENLDSINNADFSFFDKLSREISSISKISNEGLLTDNDQTKGVFLLADFQPINPKDTRKEITPTSLIMLNKLTSSKGFKAPESIIIMSGPKGFKTGTMINLLKGFVADGKKVFFADFENGVKNIRDRVLQSMAGATKDELLNGEVNEELQYLVKHYHSLGGEMRIEYFPQGISNLDDVDNKLEELKEEYNWTPDIIMYDYLDLAGAADRSIKEKRLIIQYNYHHAVRLNNKWNTFSISPSQISKEAYRHMQKHRYIDLTAFSEDFGKAANCHAAFAVCRTSYDEDNGLAYIIPVVQREGLRFKEGVECPVIFDEAKQQVIERLDSRGRPLHEKFFNAAMDSSKGFYWKEDNSGQLYLPMIGKRPVDDK